MDPENKIAARLTKNAVLSKLCDNISTTKDKNKGKIPYGFVVKPWISRDAIMNAYRRRETKAPDLIYEQVPVGTVDGAVAAPKDTVPADAAKPEG